MSRISEIKIDEIIVDDDILLRPLYPSTRKEYKEKWLRHVAFPEIDVFRDKKGEPTFLADGRHRLTGAADAGHETINCNVHKGSKREAIEFALQANDANGKPRDNKTKREAARRAIIDSEWGAWDNSEIARLCALSVSFVRKTRRQMILAGEVADPGLVKGTRKGKTIEHKLTRKQVEPKKGKTSKAKKKTQKDIARQELEEAIRLTKAQPFDGAEGRKLGLKKKDCDYMAQWWNEAAR